MGAKENIVRKSGGKKKTKLKEGEWGKGTQRRVGET